MLTITIEALDLFNEADNTFNPLPKQTIELEHSLVSLSKWESFWEIPFLSDKEHTDTQTIDYVRCMIVTPDVDPEIVMRLNPSNMREVTEYINKKMTATWFRDNDKKKSTSEQITSELIYYWMVALNIPFECQSWHLNRLLTLIQVCNEKNSPPKKMDRAEMLAQRNKLNAERLAQMQ